MEEKIKLGVQLPRVFASLADVSEEALPLINLARVNQFNLLAAFRSCTSVLNGDYFCTNNSHTAIFPLKKLLLRGIRNYDFWSSVTCRNSYV